MGAEERAHSRLSQSMSSVLDSEGLVVKTTRASGAAALRLSISSCVRYQCACQGHECNHVGVPGLRVFWTAKG